MKTHIFKYQLADIYDLGKIIEIEMPADCLGCDVNYQGNIVYMWALVDPDSPLVKRRFVIHGTGWRIDNSDDLRFIKTVHMPSGLVWHVFIVEE